MTTNTTRRTILAGLAAAPVAGLPALAGVVAGDDPIFAAIAEYRKMRGLADAAGNAVSSALDAFEKARETIGQVIFKGEDVHNLRRLDALADRDEMMLSEAEIEATIAQMRRGFAAKEAERASDAAKRQEAEYLEARAALESRLGEFKKAERDSRVVELDGAASDAYSALWDAEQAVLETKPTTRAGALALLDCGARYLEDSGSDEQATVAEAIRNAVAVLEREAQS